MTAHARPPRWARALAERAVARADRDFLISDLDDAYASRRHRGQSALVWYLAQAAHAAWTRRRSATASLPPSPTGASMPSTLMTDVLSSLRSFRKQPGAIAVVVLSLALGIGAASAMFTVVRSVLLAPLPYGQPDGLVMIWSRWVGFEKTWVSSQEVLDYRARTRVLEDVAAWSTGRVTLTGAGDATRIGAGAVTANTFNVLRVAPLIGRTFSEEEANAQTSPTAPALVVLSYGLWQRQFGGEVSAVGRRLEMNGAPATVIGVMPPGFRLPTDFGEDAAEPTELWQPLSITAANANRGNHGLFGAARLRAGATPAQAADDLARVTAELTDEGMYSEVSKFTALAIPLADDVFGSVRPALLILFGAVGFLLLIACANAAALLLARAESRQREFATRTALGANRWRLVRQQLIEGGLLAITAGALGLGLAFLARRALDAFGPAAIPRAGDVSVDFVVLAFMVGASALAAVLCTLPPAFRAFRVNLVDGLKDGNTNASIGRSRLRLRNAMVVSQIALAVLLLAGAGLMARSLWALQRIDLGFTPANVLTARIALPNMPYDTPGKINDFFDRTLTRVRALPGVEHAGLIRALPLGTVIGDWGLVVEGYAPPPGENAKGDWQVATPGALEALGERIVAGRAFTAADSANSQLVALVNEAFVRQYLNGRDPLTGRFRQGSSQEWISIVGVVADVKHNGITGQVKAKFYRPYAQYHRGGNTQRGGTLVIRTAGQPLAIAASVKAAVRELDDDIPVVGIRTMDDIVATSITAPRLTSSVLIAFAAVALTLAAIGIYGLLAYLVAERSKEIGIRMAIGARSGSIVSLVVRHGVALALGGIIAGVAASFFATRFIESQLHDVSALDPATFAIVPVILLLVALAASLAPAWRATRVDPLRTLRE
ncbi:MAG TPA: ABC transporter permease [Vicinamibacterales bacterium]|nr:ABC transporter permease [Vicinamibacterales bacterium]